MLLKISMLVFFVLNIFISDVNNTVNNSVDCVQTVTGEVRDHQTEELLAEVEILLLDDSNNVLKTMVVEKNATFSFEVKCNSKYSIKAQKKGYKLQEKEFKTSKKKRKINKILIILGAK